MNGTVISPSYEAWPNNLLGQDFNLLIVIVNKPIFKFIHSYINF